MIRDVNPLAKLIVTVAIIATAAMTTDLLRLLYLLVLALTMSMPRDPGRLVKALLSFSPMALGLGWFNALVAGNWNLGVAVALRVFILVAASAIFALTTDPYDFALSLIHQLKIPYQVAFSMAIAYGMLQEAVRSYREFVDSLKARWLIRSGLEVPRFTGTLAMWGIATISRRISQLASLMEVRGFGYRPRTYSREVRLRLRDLTFMMLGVSATTIPLLIIYAR